MARSTSSPVAASGTSTTAVSGAFARPPTCSLSLRPGPVDQEPAGLRRAAVRPAAVRPGGGASTRSAAFAIFCALSGVVYLDQRHRRSRQRSAASAQGAAADRLGRAAACRRRSAAALRARRRRRWRRPSRSVRRSALVAAAYLALQVLYSVPLKHIVIIDVLTIAIGFVLRAVAGAVAVDVEISHWLLVCTILLALFIALAKRRHELVAARRRRDEPSADSRRVQPVSARPDDRASSRRRR